jgi:Lrp/AsnC family transcriptional regulator, leucine-responsive regulatory protein
MDKIDKRILDNLQTNARINNQDLAENVYLSATPCLRRVRQLEEKGIIKQYVTLLNPQKINLNLSIIVMVGLDGHESKKMNDFELAISRFPEIVQCYLLVGQKEDYMIKVTVPDLNHYQKFLLNKLSKINGVKTIHSSCILNEIIDRTELTLKYI